MSDRISVFADSLPVPFVDRDLLERALTHASHGDGRSRAQSNERLEFLGDRVLGLLTAQRLFEAFEGLDEGGLAHRLNVIVNKKACARAAQRCGLGEALRLSPAEERLGGREKESILADACEAIIGALYLDGGLDAARAFFDVYFKPELEGLTQRPKDAKSALQEWAAARHKTIPVYATLARKGPDHRPVFEVEVQIKGAGSARGEGGSKQDAQRNAAEALLAKVTHG